MFRNRNHHISVPQQHFLLYIVAEHNKLFRNAQICCRTNKRKLPLKKTVPEQLLSNRSGTVKPFRNGHERDTVPEQFSRRNGPGCTQKGENKRTVPQRAKPFRKAQICFLTEVKLYVCSGTDYQTAAVKIVRSGTVYCSGTVYTVLACAGRIGSGTAGKGRPQAMPVTPVWVAPTPHAHCSPIGACHMGMP